jgi:hypothetical protein
MDGPYSTERRTRGLSSRAIGLGEAVADAVALAAGVAVGVGEGVTVGVQATSPTARATSKRIA